jgi:hypothetical protein
MWSEERFIARQLLFYEQGVVVHAIVVNVEFPSVDVLMSVSRLVHWDTPGDTGTHFEREGYNCNAILFVTLSLYVALSLCR